MLSTQSVKQLKALHWMAQQPYWPDVQAVLDQEEKAVLDHLVTGADKNVGHLQGRAQALRDFKKLLVQAGGVIEKLERLPSGLGNRI